MKSQVPIGELKARAYTIPTDGPESDGTFAWTETTIVVVSVAGGDANGVGYTYCSGVIGDLIAGKLAEILQGRDALDIWACHRVMVNAVRNLGRSGLAAEAISDVDAALWDLKAKLLDLPLAALLGRARSEVPNYGSGGFTSYNDATLFVDANGAYSVQQALRLGDMFAVVTWFEEPVSSDDISGLSEVRDGTPAGMDVAAGEYVFNPTDARRLLEGRAVDVLQCDASRCLDITGFLAVGTLCDTHHIDLSGHCAPALHLHAASAVSRLRHLEWSHDHVRIERLLFDGAPVPVGDAIAPDMSRPGLGLVFKHQDTE